jgi:hypothetical protein
VERQTLNKALTRAVIAGLCVSTLLLGGCRFSLPEDLYKLNRLSACPEMTLDSLVQRADRFDHTTPSSLLRCSLGLLRHSRPAPVHRTATGAKICYLLADRVVNPADREKLAAEGVRWAEIALEETAEEGRIRYYLAVNLGLAVRDSMSLALRNVRRLERELMVAVKLLPGEDQGGPLRTLGLLYLMAPPWPKGIGDGDKALDLLERAVAEYPKHPLNHIFYAQALWELEEDENLARQHLQTSNQLLSNGSWGDARKRWEKLMAELAKTAGFKLLPSR